MPRPPRIQIPNGVYHVTARGNRRQAVFVTDADRRSFLYLLGAVSRRFGWKCGGYCLLPDHYHLLVETLDANLSRGMQHLNGRYAQLFNHVHGFDGHVFQGRFHAVLVGRDPHLLEVIRYIALNPVRAGFCSDPADWHWGSYRALAGHEASPPFLDERSLLGRFGRDQPAARATFRAFIADHLPRMDVTA
jgi:putative transposase